MILLERFAHTPMGVFGRLRVHGTRGHWFTVERPWLRNEAFVSCIPEGEYAVELGMFNRPKVPYPAYELQKVPGRTEIKIHVGNTVRAVVGCIAPGCGLGTVYGLWAVTDSTKGFGEFMDAMGGVERDSILIYSSRGG